MTAEDTHYDDSLTAVAMKVSVVSIIVNIVLSLLKLLAGLIASSGAMISDAVHSASDVFSTLVVIVGVRLAKKKPDKEHPYGHERMECVASIILAAVLAATGIGIGLSGIEKIASPDAEELAVPGLLALTAAVVSMIVKEVMFRYTKHAAKKINSGALMADAWHHRSDALSSVGAFAGILGARMGMPVLDPLASVIICVFIEKAAVDIFRDAVDKMVDRSCPDETVDGMKEVILGTQGVLGIDELKTRLFGSKIYVEVEILMDAGKTLVEAHDTAEEVHRAIEEAFPEVKHCMVHVNPDIGE
ncbi:MAG: cation transporter [Ruminiclostridium sp.]|nr:cation transporter [Ruminiclostridium sp.]